MGRTVQGPTLGGDFTVTYAEEGELTSTLALTIDAHPEKAHVEAVIARQRFPGRETPKFGDKLRVVIGLSPVTTAYDEPRESKVGVPTSLLRLAVERLGDDPVAQELDDIVRSVDDFLDDVGAQ